MVKKHNLNLENVGYQCPKTLGDGPMVFSVSDMTLLEVSLCLFECYKALNSFAWSFYLV